MAASCGWRGSWVGGGMYMVTLYLQGDSLGAIQSEFCQGLEANLGEVTYFSCA